MKLVLFGATGHTGRYILREALKAGHEVSVLVRDSSKLPERPPNLHIIQGDALNPDEVLAAVQGQDAVVSAISEGPDIRQHTQSQAVRHMIAAMKQAGIDRIICMGAIGILQHNEKELIRDQDFYDETYRPISYEHSAVNRLLSDSGLRWTQVCPPTILAEEANDHYAVSADYPPTKNMEVNAGNIGRFILRALVNNEYVGKRAGITNA